MESTLPKVSRLLRYFLMVALAAGPGSVILSDPVQGGANASGRVRLSWERDWNTPSLPVVVGDTLILYCRIEDTPDIRALGIVLQWEPKATSQCFGQITTPEWVNCGRVLVEEQEPRSFAGQAFRHRIAYRPNYDRRLIAFAFLVHGCEHPTPTTFYVASARTRDSQGRIDQLDPIGAAHVQAGALELPTYNPPPDRLVSGHFSNLDSWWGRSIGTPRYRPFRNQMAPSGPPEQAALSVLSSVASELQIPNPATDLSLKQIYQDGAVTVAKFDQRSNGVPVYTGGVTVALARSGRVIRVSNRFIPHARLAGANPSLSHDEARRRALNELGLPPNLSANSSQLVVYPTLNEATLCWKESFDASPWSVFVNAQSGAITAIENAAHYDTMDAQARVWLANPRVAWGDTLYPPGNPDTFCDFPDGQVYKVISLHDVTDSPPGLWRLQGRRTKLTYFTGTVPFTSNQTPPDFRAYRCIPPNTIDSNGFLSQVLLYYYIDRANEYFYDIRGFQRDPLYPLPMIVDYGSSAGRYESNIRRISYGRVLAEEATHILHEYGHALQHDQTGDGFDSQNSESHGLAEGGIANFIATNLLAHQLRNSVAPADTIPFEFLIGEWQPVGGAKYMRNRTLYPWDFVGDDYLAGSVFANALWDAFDYFETQMGNCGTLSTSFINSCATRDAFYDRLRYAFNVTGNDEGPSCRSVARAMMEYEQAAGGQRLNGMLQAFDSHGWFFTEHDSAFGIAFDTVAVPRDTTAHGLKLLGLRLFSTSGITSNSVVLRYGADGAFPHTVQMVQDQQQPGLYWGTMNTQVLAPEVFVTYYVMAQNGLGVTSHWPKGAPEQDRAIFYVGQFLDRPTYSSSGGRTVAAGAIDSSIIIVPNAAGLVVFDVNVHLDVVAQRIGAAKLQLIHPNGIDKPFLIRNIQQNQVSWPWALDVWLDDSQDAPYHHFPLFDAFNTPTLAGAFRGKAIGGAWKLLIDNSGSSGNRVGEFMG